MCEDRETQGAGTRARKRDNNNVFWMRVGESVLERLLGAGAWLERVET